MSEEEEQVLVRNWECIECLMQGMFWSNSEQSMLINGQVGRVVPVWSQFRDGGAWRPMLRLGVKGLEPFGRSKSIETARCDMDNRFGMRHVGARRSRMFQLGRDL